MTDIKHTPTPWVLKDEHIYTEYGRLIAATDGSELSWGEDESNAAHIVKCVNMHEELVDVLDSVLDGIKLGYNLGYLEDEVEKVLKKAGAL